MSKILFTQAHCTDNNYYPFSLTRRIQDFVLGAFTIRKKWEMWLDSSSVDVADDYFTEDTDVVLAQIKESYLLLHGHVLPTEKLVAAIQQLKVGAAISCQNKVIAFHINEQYIINGQLAQPDSITEIADITLLEYSWQMPQLNKQELVNDFYLFTRSRKSAMLHPTCNVSNAAHFFIAESATATHCIFNTDEGPVFIDDGALLMEGALLRGPIYIGKNAVVKMGAKIYGATTVSANCTVGGEIKNSIIFPNSNKAHDGYLGDAVVGEWCNFGAGATNSNVKNNAGIIEICLKNEQHKVGLKCGVLMGDYSRAAINTSINTGTVIGVCANVFGNGLTPKNIDSFSWGYDDPLKYKLDKALEHIDNWMQFKKATLTSVQKKILEKIFNQNKV